MKQLIIDIIDHIDEKDKSEDDYFYQLLISLIIIYYQCNNSYYSFSLFFLSHRYKCLKIADSF